MLRRRTLWLALLAAVGASNGCSQANTTAANGSSGVAGAVEGGGSDPVGGAGPSMAGSTTATGADGVAGTPPSGGTAAMQAGAGGTPASGGTASGGAGGLAAGGMSNAGSSGTAAAGNSSGGASAMQCPRVTAGSSPKLLNESGNLSTHDPAVLGDGGVFYLFQTGRGLPTKTSNDLLSWQSGGAVFSQYPAWIADAVPGVADLWAPDISKFGGSYHLYYAASTFGSRRSCIGHATRASLTTGSWSDHGSVVCTTTSDDFNAIDPNVAIDDDGTPWLAFGSFWGGIKLIQLDSTGARVGTKIESIAARPKAGGALEGPFIVRACGYFYLFVSFDHCCDSPWNYNIRVGRSKAINGPYVDRDGVAMLQGGGSLLVQGSASVTAPGHNAVVFRDGAAYNIYHALNANHQAAALRVAELAWDDQDWPVSGGP